MINVTAWHDHLGRTLRPAGDGPHAGAVARFADIDGRIDQPALDADVIAIHLGGPKRVIRRDGARETEVDVPPASFTIMPASLSFGWETFGPIDFAHLTVDPAALRAVAAGDLDRDPDAVRLEPVIGAEDPDLQGVVAMILAAGPATPCDRLRREEIAAATSLRLLDRFAGRPAIDARRHPRRGTLATWQLRRVVDHMRDNLADDIALATLVALTGLGRARFFHAFRQSMGRTPFAHLLHLRLLRARTLLIETTRSITEIAAAVGLDPNRLAVAFRRAYGLSPREFRARHRA